VVEDAAEGAVLAGDGSCDTATSFGVVVMEDNGPIVVGLLSGGRLFAITKWVLVAPHPEAGTKLNQQGSGDEKFNETRTLPAKATALSTWIFSLGVEFGAPQ